ncbi:hypothetical protein DFJ73DRAFT_190310 [Zopfochytrium polystomum]|nr:hypothetical protein DFJ73DRAFT_190310 [Zopfochytrium polystomum]
MTSRRSGIGEAEESEGVSSKRISIGDLHVDNQLSSFDPLDGNPQQSNQGLPQLHFIDPMDIRLHAGPAGTRRNERWTHSEVPQSDCVSPIEDVAPFRSGLDHLRSTIAHLRNATSGPCAKKKTPSPLLIMGEAADLRSKQCWNAEQSVHGSFEQRPPQLDSVNARCGDGNLPGVWTEQVVRTNTHPHERETLKPFTFHAIPNEDAQFPPARSMFRSSDNVEPSKITEVIAALTEQSHAIKALQQAVADIDQARCAAGNYSARSGKWVSQQSLETVETGLSELDELRNTVQELQSQQIALREENLRLAARLDGKRAAYDFSVDAQNNCRDSINRGLQQTEPKEGGQGLSETIMTSMAALEVAFGNETSRLWKSIQEQEQLVRTAMHALETITTDLESSKALAVRVRILEDQNEALVKTNESQNEQASNWRKIAENALSGQLEVKQVVSHLEEEIRSVAEALHHHPSQQSLKNLMKDVQSLTSSLDFLERDLSNLITEAATDRETLSAVRREVHSVADAQTKSHTAANERMKSFEALRGRLEVQESSLDALRAQLKPLFRRHARDENSTHMSNMVKAVVAPLKSQMKIWQEKLGRKVDTSVLEQLMLHLATRDEVKAVVENMKTQFDVMTHTINTSTMPLSSIASAARAVGDEGGSTYPAELVEGLLAEVDGRVMELEQRMASVVEARIRSHETRLETMLRGTVGLHQPPAGLRAKRLHLRKDQPLRGHDEVSQTSSTTSSLASLDPDGMPPKKTPSVGGSSEAGPLRWKQAHRQPREALDAQSNDGSTDSLVSTMNGSESLPPIEGNSDRTEKLIRTLSREFDEKLFMLCADLSACKAAYEIAARQPFYRCGLWLWRCSNLRHGSAVPWNLESTNTDPDNFLWEQDQHFIKVVEAGLYEISFAFFTRCKPSVQLVVNGDSVLSALNSPTYVVHHASGFMANGEGKLESGAVTGLSLLVSPFFQLVGNLTILIIINRISLYCQPNLQSLCTIMGGKNNFLGMASWG